MHYRWLERPPAGADPAAARAPSIDLIALTESEEKSIKRRLVGAGCDDVLRMLIEQLRRARHRYKHRFLPKIADLSYSQPCFGLRRPRSDTTLPVPSKTTTVLQISAKQDTLIIHLDCTLRLDFLPQRA